MFISVLSTSAQDSLNYKIDIAVSNYEQDTLIVGYYFGDRQLVKDTIIKDDESMFSFAGTDTLQSGMYLILMKPSNEFVQFLVPKDDLRFSINMNASVLSDIQFEGSEINTQFYEYLDFLSDRRFLSDSLNYQIENADSLGIDVAPIKKQIEFMNSEVAMYQSQTVADHPNSLLSQLIKSSFAIDLPEFEGTKEEITLSKYLYYRDHYFDHIDLTDPANQYMPYLHSRVDYYINKLIPQHPDSINVAIDDLLDKVSVAPNTYKFYLSNFLSKYGNSRVVGMDAVFVHLVENYYSKGKAPWADEKSIKKMASSARRIKPTLIGKIGADLQLYTEDSTAIKLSEIECDFMVLMFWAPKCGHCTKAMPYAVDFNAKYKDKGVKFISICTKHQDKYPSCWTAVKEKGMESFLNLGDQHHKSRFKTKYNVDKTPKIFIMDSDRKILIKDVGAQQLDRIMEQLLEKDRQKGKME